MAETTGISWCDALDFPWWLATPQAHSNDERLSLDSQPSNSLSARKWGSSGVTAAARSTRGRLSETTLPAPTDETAHARNLATRHLVPGTSHILRFATDRSPTLHAMTTRSKHAIASTSSYALADFPPPDRSHVLTAVTSGRRVAAGTNTIITRDTLPKTILWLRPYARSAIALAARLAARSSKPGTSSGNTRPSRWTSEFPLVLVPA